jgi:arylsulfatase A-like enzyme
MGVAVLLSYNANESSFPIGNLLSNQKSSFETNRIMLTALAPFPSKILNACKLAIRSRPLSFLASPLSGGKGSKLLSLFGVVVLVFGGSTPLSQVIAEERTNIVYILADDLGWTDLACYGSKYYETPNIDALAASGIRFLNYHNCQNCQPTRAALLSGQYGPRSGVYTVGGIDRFDWSMRPLRPVDNVTSLPIEKITIAQALKNSGYSTGMFGKWHLGNDKQYHPLQRGFDEALSWNGDHFDYKTDPPSEHPKGQYLADFLTDKAVDFIARNQSKPFFLYLPHYAVHAPIQAKPELISKFQNKPGVGGHSNPKYAAMIASVDESVGRIVKLLDDLKLSEKTLIVFSSDNGGVGGYVREGLKESGDVTDNAPLRSGKGSLYEGGIRDPFIVKWPGKVKPGTTCPVPAIHVDVYPTLLQVANCDSPNDYPLDGESLVPLLKAESTTLKREAIYQHFPGYLGAGKDTWRTTPVGLIQMGTWKLMEFFEDNRLELYNLADDPGESKNLAKSMPEKTAELHQRMIAWRKEIRAPMPTPNDPTSKSAGEVKKKSKNQKKKKKAEAEARS